MTIEELSARMDAKFEEVDKKMDAKFEAVDKKMDARFDAVDKKMDARFEAVGKAMEEGFDASRARDEELRDLTKFGLEAREILRDEIHRRFDASDRKTDLQITLLKDAVGHLTKHK